jgi:hypothetical protein
VNAEGSCGQWSYTVARNPNEIPAMIVDAAADRLTAAAGQPTAI